MSEKNSRAISHSSFAPPFATPAYSSRDRKRLEPFFTNLNKSAYVPLIFSPEVIGALCSRTSRAAGDLRTIFVQEYLNPFLSPRREKTDTPAIWKAKQHYGKQLQEFIRFIQKHPFTEIFSNPRARSFYAKWLAQYGDDSIAQMAGMHLVYSSLSQVAIKHFEDQRIGLAPIEKSTRYVDYSQKIRGKYLYYTDPTFKALKLDKVYTVAMDGLFETYIALRPKLTKWLHTKFPNEKPGVVEKKAFDTLRGLLPASTLSQVAFFGNGQSFEYLVSRSLQHPLGEIRWAGEQAYQELYKLTPAFLRRVKDAGNQVQVQQYQEYLTGKGQRVAPLGKKALPGPATSAGTSVQLLEYDSDGEAKAITGMLYYAPGQHHAWDTILQKVKKMNTTQKREIIDAYFAGRTQRWQKVGRALENVYVRFEIAMNIGGWRDLHRHRMHTQQRQLFTCIHGYDVPPEIEEAGLSAPYSKVLEKAANAYERIAKRNEDLAQYAVPMAYRVRFMQWQNLREAFWEIELRTIPEGHPDYRKIEQDKFRLLEKVYPLLMEKMHVNLGEYDFARRGQEEKIAAKLKELEKIA